MAKHIHIPVHSTRDADGPKHAPAGSSNGGQFVATTGGSGSPQTGAAHHTEMAKRHSAASKSSSDPIERDTHKVSAKMHKEAAANHTDTKLSERANKQSHSQVAQSKSKAETQAKNAKTPVPTQPRDADLASHPQYHKNDLEYLKGKGWKNDAIKQRWDEEAAQGHKPQQVNKHNPPSVFDV